MTHSGLLAQARRVALLLTGLSACGTAQRTERPESAAGQGGHAASGNGGGSGSGSGGAGSAGIPAGGSGGRGAGGLRWELVTELEGCRLERLLNPSEAPPLLTWQPHFEGPFTEGVFDAEHYVGSSFNPVRYQLYSGDGRTAVAMTISLHDEEPSLGVLVDDRGQVLDAFRSVGVDEARYSCGSAWSATWDGRFAYEWAITENWAGGHLLAEYVAVVDRAGTGTPRIAKLPTVRDEFVVEARLGKTHLGLVDWPGGAPATLSLAGLDGFRVLRPPRDSNELYPRLDDTVGSGFLYSVWVRERAPDLLWKRIMFTDGVSEHLLFEDTQADLGGTRFAHSHLAWVRAFGARALNDKGRYYEHIELWASPFSTDPAALSPTVDRRAG